MRFFLAGSGGWLLAWFCLGSKTLKLFLCTSTSSSAPSACYSLHWKENIAAV